jgi:hypothetical protein
MTTHLVTFSDASMSVSAHLCWDSFARQHGVDGHWVVTDEWLRQTPFYSENRALLSQSRGLGYWSWKPFIILERLRQLERGVLVYADAGIEFVGDVNEIIKRMDQDIFLFGNNWGHAYWCKRDIAEFIWPTLVKYQGETYDAYLRRQWAGFGKQCQASVIFFRVSGYSRRFVAEWLKWCLFEGGRLIDDSPSRTPNHPEFRENRHDQAILTTLAYREGIKLHYWPAVYNKGGSPEFVYEKLPEYAGDSYPTLFFHHRKRNHEWEAAGGG